VISLTRAILRALETSFIIRRYTNLRFYLILVGYSNLVPNMPKGGVLFQCITELQVTVSVGSTENAGMENAGP